MAGTVALPRPTRPSRRLWLVATALAAAAAIAVVAAIALTGGKQAPSVKTLVGNGGRFAISYPQKSWHAFPASRLAKLPGRPAAVLASNSGSATVVVREQAPVSGSLTKLGRSLTPQLAKRFRGFRALSARVVSLPTGPALTYTFVRGSTQAVQTEVIVPAAGRSYALDVVTRRATRATSAQAGAIVRSFLASR